MGEPLQCVAKRRRRETQLLRLASGPLLLRLTVALGRGPHLLGLALQFASLEAIVLEDLNGRGHLADLVAALGSLDVNAEIAAGENRHQVAKGVDRFHDPRIYSKIGGCQNKGEPTEQDQERIVAG